MFEPERYEIIGFVAFYDDGLVVRSDEIDAPTLYGKFTQLPMDGLQALNTYQRFEGRLYESIHGVQFYFATPEGVIAGNSDDPAVTIKRHPGAFFIAGRQMENVAYMTLLEDAMNTTEF